MFLHLNLQKHAWTTPHGNTHQHIYLILTDRGYSRILDLRSFRGVDCDCSTLWFAQHLVEHICSK